MSVDNICLLAKTEVDLSNMVRILTTVLTDFGLTSKEGGLQVTGSMLEGNTRRFARDIHEEDSIDVVACNAMPVFSTVVGKDGSSASALQTQLQSATAAVWAHTHVPLDKHTSLRTRAGEFYKTVVPVLFHCVHCDLAA